VTSRRDATTTRLLAALALAGTLAMGALAAVAWAGAVQTSRVTVKSNGAEVNADNDAPSISGTGRYVAFQSVGKFTAGDVGVDGDVFVRDRATGTTRRASLRSNGTEVNTPDGSEHASISADGRFVAFTSDAAFTAGDQNGALDVYVHDFQKGTTRRMSITSGGQQVMADSEEAAISATGRYVAFQSEGALTAGDTNGVTDVFVRDRVAGKTRRASLRSGLAQPTEDSTDPAISGNGRYVAFATSDSEMTSEPDYGTFPLLDSDVFVRDMTNKTTRRVSLTSGENEADPNSQIGSRDPAISAKGNFVTFVSPGRFVPADANGFEDVYIRSLNGGTTRLVSVKSNEDLGNDDSGVAYHAPLSNNGRYVAFESLADLAATDGDGFRDVYMRDRTAGTTTRISLKANGGEVPANHQEPAITADGRFVAFASLGAFTANDSGNDFDAFLRGPLH
jgi:Tol biopolymer transport system component